MNGFPNFIYAINLNTSLNQHHYDLRHSLKKTIEIKNLFFWHTQRN